MPLGFPNRGSGKGDLKRRKSPRYQTNTLPAFNFGEVVDLSATGMRIRRPGKPHAVVGATEKFVIIAGSGPLCLQGKVVWVKGPGLLAKHHEYGVHFTGLDASLRERLLHIGEYGFDSGPALESQVDRAKRKLIASIEVEDLYPILGVEPTATQEELGAAYRTLVRRWHPDVCKEPDAEEQLARVSKAYKVLRDADLRSRYDQMRDAARLAA